MDQEKEKSVFRALGVDEEWEILNDHRLEKEYNSCETVSDTLLIMAQRIKREEFGEITDEISTYERKLMLSSLTLAQMILQKRAINGLQSAIISHIASQLNSEGGSEKNDDED
jgi:hypothetical protein